MRLVAIKVDVRRHAKASISAHARTANNLFYLFLSGMWPFAALYCRTFKLMRDCYRYFSVISITLSNVGFFGSFSSDACNHFFFISPIFKGAVASFRVFFLP